jgi:hypothetical protein
MEIQKGNCVAATGFKKRTPNDAAVPLPPIPSRLNDSDFR